MGEKCSQTNLASDGPFRVDRCSCGTINLHAGSISLRLEQDLMEQLATTLAKAMLRNRELCEAMNGPCLSLVPSPDPMSEQELDEVSPLLN
tara:strand:- start:16 stop:288 length:273 start_codon:yes stop_codon:yes gene_type:complete